MDITPFVAHVELVKRKRHSLSTVLYLKINRQELSCIAKIFV